MSLLKKVCNPFESGTPRIIFMLFRWFNPVKCMNFDIFVGRQHNHFQEVDLISADSLLLNYKIEIEQSTDVDLDNIL